MHQEQTTAFEPKRTTHKGSRVRNDGLTESRYLGTVCKKHPHLNGLRYKDRRSCIGCQRDALKTTPTYDKPEYLSWKSMIQRCNNPNHIYFKYYGGRGIKVCERWLNSFEAFHADMGARPEGLTLDRVNNDGDYGPDNCRWATKAEQVANRRNSKQK